MRSGRMRRVDEAMRAVLSDAIGKDLKDPRVGFVTVTGVKTSPDLRHARVYVSVLGTDAEREESIDGLRSAHGFLQRRLADELTLKHTPSLSFHYDESVDRGMRISSLVSELERDDDSSGSQGDQTVVANDGADGLHARQGRGDGDEH
jgi:ribosome-binding factor A